MNDGFSYKTVPASRIATFDTFSIGLQKHHVAALLEFDVTESRRKLQEYRRGGVNISFNGWLAKVIGSVLKEHPEAAAYLNGKRRLMVFNDINISIIVEKMINGERVPIPVVIEKTNEKTAQEITAEIDDAKKQELSGSDIVINRRSRLSERFYYHLPGFARRFIWRVMLANPRFAYQKMGNAAVTSVGMMGKVNGWFIHRSVHPVSFGIGSVIKKPVVINNEVKIRDILNMTVLVDHDLVDGAPMVRMLKDLTNYIEAGAFTDHSTLK
jgi:pyruvate/2-oxoglutarate dehydrogenase complex dihydrolipoamide acyltransferase (E2) component